VLAALATALGCSRTATRAPAPTASASPSAASASTSSSAADAAPPPSASVAPPPPLSLAPPRAPAFLDVVVHPPTAIRVKGYPHAIHNGMNDPAMHAGFTKDGTLFGYCSEVSGRDPPVSTCELVDRAGRVTKLSSETGDAFDARKKKELDAFVSGSGIPGMKGKDMASLMPPPLVGTWAFGDITLEVLRVAATLDKQGAPSAPAVVKLGGAVGKHAPVFPITLSKALVPEAPPHFAVMNVLALSPDGRDVGMVGHFFACEYCDSFDMKRMPVGALASQIYNDTGYRLHQGGDFAASAELFARAVHADPAARLPPYNLACAWARTRHPRAKDALAHALERDPTAKARARTDADFDAVRGEEWFVSLVR